MKEARRSLLDVLLGAAAIVVCATVLGLVSNHYVRRPVVLLAPPRVAASPNGVPPLPTPNPSKSDRRQ